MCSFYSDKVGEKNIYIFFHKINQFRPGFIDVPERVVKLQEKLLRNVMKSQNVLWKGG